jgi:hypothetical protein
MPLVSLVEKGIFTFLIYNIYNDESICSIHGPHTTAIFFVCANISLR